MKTFFLAKNRLAGLIEDGKLTYSSDLTKKRGTILRGKIIGRNTAIDAFYVDIGEEKPALLHDRDVKRRGEMTPIVEVIRDHKGDKASVVSARFTLGGKFVVLVDDESVGFSKKIVGEDLVRLRKFAQNHGMRGFFYRTAAKIAPEEEILIEYEKLHAIRKKLLRERNNLDAPCVLYKPQPWNDFADTADLLMTDDESYASAKNAKHITNVLEDITIKSALCDLSRRTYPLLCGGEIVVDITEALVVFDINSKSARAGNFKALARRVNDEAAREIARIIRIRNLGGILVIDFLREDQNGQNRIRELMTALLKEHTSRIVLHGFSSAGLFEITRQRE